MLNKKKEEKAIFYDIFIQPKENKIKELRQKDYENKQKKQIKDKKQNGKDNTVKEEIKENKANTTKIEVSSDKVNQIQGNHSIINEQEMDSFSKYLSSKYIPKPKDENKSNFFNQLIQIKPPEGINAVVASPLIDSKGWAPSIPSMQLPKKTNINDLMMRARGGIQAGDISKEAHMAFYLGAMNEEAKKYDEVIFDLK
jgi:hypothetical protein